MYRLRASYIQTAVWSSEVAVAVALQLIRKDHRVPFLSPTTSRELWTMLWSRRLASSSSSPSASVYVRRNNGSFCKEPAYVGRRASEPCSCPRRNSKAARWSCERGSLVQQLQISTQAITRWSNSCCVILPSAKTYTQTSHVERLARTCIAQQPGEVPYRTIAGRYQ